MKYSYYKHLKLILLNSKSNFLSYKRHFSDVKSFESVKLVNPLKRKVRPPIGIVNESRVANRICITVLGNGGIGQPRCVGLFTDLKGYLFNCGEGVGRFCREYDVNTCFIKHIFVTQKKWENVSGISDIFLTNQAFGIFQMSIHGPPGIECFSSMISSEKSFLDLNIKDISNKFHIDHTLKIEYVPIACEHEASPSFVRRKQNRKSNSDIACSYICKIFEKCGDFLIEKCVEYGVPVGPDLLKLKNGEDVVLSSGKIVYAKDVNGPNFPGPVILVVDCPSESFLEPFICQKRFEMYQLPLNTSPEVFAIFHFTPPHIFSSAKYQDWIKRFHQDTLHIVLNSDNPTTSSAAVHLSQKYFNLLDSKIFSNLKEITEPSGLTSNGTIIHPPPMMQLHIRPEYKISQTNVVNLSNDVEEDGTEPVKGSSEFYVKLNQLKSAIIKNTLLNKNNQVYPEVLFLGTSSSTSTAYRNVSAIVVNTSSSNTILLDCGEGTMMQFTRYYGSDVYQALRHLSCIFISHKHIDHYLGLFELVSQRIKAFEFLGVPYQPVLLILPYDILVIFKKFCEAFENFLPAVEIFTCNYVNKKREKFESLPGNIELITVPVKHCWDAHGVILQQGSDWKIVYSGDTAPCQKLIDAGMDCTLLIHEASIEDGMLNEALAKKHSTPSQVIDISEKMNAKYTITTHFSKRYLALPVIPDCNDRHITYAFDFMKVRMCDWSVLPLFTPIMKSLFQEQLESHSERTSLIVNFENTFLKVLKS